MKIKSLMLSMLMSVSMVAALIPTASFAGTGGHDESDIVYISYAPAGQYYGELNCDWDDDYWGTPYPVFGDKMTVYYSDNKSDTYVYKQAVDPDGYQYMTFANVKDQNDELEGYAEFDIDEHYAPVSAYKSGDVKTVKTNVVYEGEKATRTPITISIKFRKDHGDELVRTPAKEPTCTKTGNIEYWYCKWCKKYFSDADGQKEIAKGSWGLPAGHKMVHYNTSGYLRNGSEYDQCKVCGETANVKAAAGFSKSFAKSVKVKKGKGSLTVKWKKQSKSNQKQFNGYQIRYSKSANMSGAKYATAAKSSKSKKIGKLSKKTRYYVQVRTFTKANGVTFYSGWSDVKSIKTK